MKKTNVTVSAAWLATLLVAPAASLLTPGDVIFSYDLDANDTFPGAESPAQGVDGNPATKYLNFGNRHSGLIMTPTSGSASVQSFNFTTGNDSPERDPTSYLLFGTNEPITGSNVGNANINGFNQNWTFISGGSLSFSNDRLATTSPVDIVNGSSWASYWMVFPTTKDNGGAPLQFADVFLYDGAGGGGASILGGGATTLATSWDASFPGGEAPPNLLDGLSNTKFLSFGKENAGLWIEPAAGATTVRSFKITTAGDAPERDPASWRLLGQNSGGVWTEIDSGALSLTDDRETESGFIPVGNDTEHLAYRMEFDSLKNSAGANSIQMAGLQFFDVVPEPSTSLLGLLGAAGLLVRRKR